jgi:large subunit ribosomal protein L24
MPNLHPKVLAKNLVKNWKIVSGDLVQVMVGKDAGKQGIVKKVLRHKNRLIVEGCMLQKKRVRPTGDQKGHIVTQEGSIHYSNVMLIDPKTGKPTRVGYKYLEDGTKVRVSKKSGEIIPKPERKMRVRTSNPERDTAPDEAYAKTYTYSEMIELKNRFLRVMELNYYSYLKWQYEEQQKNNLRQLYEQKVFDLQVYQRAQELLREKRESKSN